MVYSEKKDEPKPKGLVKLEDITIPVAAEDKVFKFTLENRDFILKAMKEETNG